jgi:enhancing lycopene biosynthesis protein 2
MVSPVETVQAALLANSVVTALAGTRVFQTTRTQAFETPAVAVSQVGRTPFNHLAGPPTLDAARVQVDSFATTRGQCRALADACRAALEAVGIVTEGEFEGFEPDVAEYRITQDFSVWT